MTLSQEMLQAAGAAPTLLADAGDRVVDFIRSQMNEDGGFKGRSMTSDLYYTVFGIECLLALRADVPFERVEHYLQQFGSGQSLDLVHLACLARCWSHLPEAALADNTRQEMRRALERFRTSDGGYGADAAAENGTVYGCFVGFGACEDLRAELPNPADLIRCVRSLKTEDGAYANERSIPVGSTPATAAAVTLLRHLGQDAGEAVGRWLLDRFEPPGGFVAMPLAPLPDLLSTATALHGLAGMNVSLDSIREPCLRFVRSLWSDEGAFRGHEADDDLDCEYTFYGLLALGHLSA